MDTFVNCSFKPTVCHFGIALLIYEINIFFKWNVDSLLVGRNRVCCICCFSSTRDVMFRWYQVPGSKFSILHLTCERSSRSGWQSVKSLCCSLRKTLYWHFISSLSNVMIIDFVVEIVLTILMLHCRVHTTMVLWKKLK